MIKNNKWKILISSFAIVLPSVIALILKEKIQMGLRGTWYFTWIMPLIMLALNFVCIFITMRDNSGVYQNQKIINMIFWIMPCISIYSSGIFLALGLGLEFNIGMVLFIILGSSFIIMGNYLPKTVRNRTFGIKLGWTMANDANWAATHRFSGKLWVITGLLTLALAFIPMDISFILLGVLIVVIVVPPIIYSYRFYKKQLASGEATKEDYESYPMRGKDKKTFVISLIVTGVILALVAVLMFVGEVKITAGEESLEVKPTLGGGITLDYGDIESIEYRSEKVDGHRVSGYASARLLYGWFKNDEFGNYSRYTYTDSDSAIVIYTDDDVLVISAKSDEETMNIYENIIMRMGGGQ